MDIISMLKADHREVGALLKKLLKTRAKTAKKSIFTKIYKGLTVHSAFEEKVFYPALKKASKTKGLVLEAYEEHHLIKILLTELKRTSPTNESWQAKATVLEEIVKHHVKEEEGELFPKSKHILDQDQLVAMGEKYLKAKTKKGLK